MSRAPLLFDTLIEQQRLHEEEMSATRGPMFERDNGIGRGEFNFAKLRNRSGSPHPAHPEFEQLQLMQQFHKLSLNDPGLPDEQPAAPQPQGVVPQLRAAEFGLPNVWMWRGSEQPKEEPASFAEQPEEPLALPAELHTSAILNLRDLPIALCRQNQPPFQYYIGIPLSAFKNPQPIVHLGRLQQPWSPPQPRRSGRQRRPVVRYGYEIY
ncbi:unnamed protein product [Orchesella dallaii]|uniref:Uncharacterized protein n=1 Tax=Orchesella dallaii TaxID=48710 RepID=A0ABP1R9L1_9HEXA